MTPRHLLCGLRDALADTPVVMLVGARQTGKSTLAQSPALIDPPRRYLTLDDPTVLAAARTDPTGFIAGLGEPVVLDEIQRAPELFLPIKASVDRQRRPGRFLLTGSANVLLLPKVADALVGRMEVLTLFPFSQGEMEGVREGMLEALFSTKPPPLPVAESEGARSRLLERLCAGGYPEACARGNAARRKAWFQSYLTTLLDRDVRDLANLGDLTALPRLLALASARVGALLNFAELSRTAGLPQSTLKRYQTLLERLFLLQPLPPWSGNLGKRLIQTPKLYLADTGLLAHLLGATPGSLHRDATLLGPLLENFVLAELRKQCGWSTVRPSLFHWRTASGQEVDCVLEDASGRLVGVEVKATASLGANHLLGLRALAEAAGKRFVRGIVLYTGREVIPFAANLHALPMSALWRWGSERVQ